MRCLAGEGSRRGSALACVTTPDDVLNELFSASYVGGVNGQGQGGAYARLYAWESLYALMGLPTCVPLLEAVRRAADHRGLRFMAFTDWFHHDTSDLAFAVLDPTRGAGGDRYRCPPQRSWIAGSRPWHLPRPCRHSESRSFRPCKEGRGRHQYRASDPPLDTGRRGSETMLLRPDVTLGVFGEALGASAYSRWRAAVSPGPGENRSR